MIARSTPSRRRTGWVLAAFLLSGSALTPSWADTDFRSTVIGAESSGNYAIFNQAGTTQALGAYQFLPSTFAGLGYMNYNGGPKSQWSSYSFSAEARAAGVSSLSDLRYSSAGHALQDGAFDRFTTRNWNAMNGTARGAVGTTLGGVPITREGLLSNAHFLGAGGLNSWAAAGFDASVLPMAVVRANGFANHAELQDYLMGRMAKAAGTTFTPGTSMAGFGGGGAGMYEGTDGFPGLGSKRPVLLREVPPFQGQRANLTPEG